MNKNILIVMLSLATVISSRAQLGPIVKNPIKISNVKGKSAAKSSGTSSGGGIGFSKTYASCEGQLSDGTNVKFEVLSTVAQSVVNGILTNKDTNEYMIQLLCERGEENAVGSPTAVKTEWICQEYMKVDDGDISVQLTSGGFVGIVMGEVSQKQMYPLAPARIGTLLCK